MEELKRLIENDQKMFDKGVMTKYGEGYLQGLKRALELILADNEV